MTPRPTGGRARAGRTADKRGGAKPMLRLLSDVGAAFAESLDYEETFAKAARLVVPAFADWCVIDVVEDDGQIKRVEVTAPADVDPAVVALVRELPADLSSDPTRPTGRALIDRKPVLVEKVGIDMLAAPAPDERHASAMRESRLRSLIAAPLLARGRILGVLTFGLREGRRPYGAHELATAEQLAYRAAMSIDNARLYHEAQEKSARYQEASRAKDEFLAMLGHELRNPLAPILTALELLRMREGTALAAEYAIIDRHVKHLVTLVDDLLDVSRIASGRIELRRRRMALQAVVDRAVEIALPLIEQRRHELTVDVGPGFFVDADEHRLAQVFANLLTNAAKYTELGGHIRVTASRDDGGVRVAVQDDGIGIGAALLPHVFDRFVQSKRTVERAEGGLGLGLAIVGNLVEQHGGRSCVHSDGAGKGTTFTIWLPAARSVAGVGETAGGTGLPRLPRASAGRVLVVDDNRDLADVVAEYLRESGFDVRVAYDGPQALTVAARFQPVLALLDIGLPVMDGIELAQRLALTTPPPLLVAMSGYGQPRDLEQTARAGFARHLVKPVDPALVRATIRELIGRAKIV